MECGYVIHTHFFISSTKFPKLLPSYANYFYTSEAHTTLKYIALLYAYILQGAGIQTGRRCEFLYDTMQGVVPQLPLVEWEIYLSVDKAFMVWR